MGTKITPLTMALLSSVLMGVDFKITHQLADTGGRNDDPVLAARLSKTRRQVGVTAMQFTHHLGC
jgi:hypothetical protein